MNKGPNIFGILWDSLTTLFARVGMVILLLAILAFPIVVVLCIYDCVRTWWRYTRFLKKLKKYNIPNEDVYRWTALLWKFRDDEKRLKLKSWPEHEKCVNLFITGISVVAVCGTIWWVKIHWVQDPNEPSDGIPAWPFLAAAVIGAIRCIAACVRAAADPYYIPESWEDPDFHPLTFEFFWENGAYKTMWPDAAAARVKTLSAIRKAYPRSVVLPQKSLREPPPAPLTPEENALLNRLTAAWPDDKYMDHLLKDWDSLPEDVVSELVEYGRLKAKCNKAEKYAKERDKTVRDRGLTPPLGVLPPPLPKPPETLPIPLTPEEDDLLNRLIEALGAHTLSGGDFDAYISLSRRRRETMLQEISNAERQHFVH